VSRTFGEAFDYVCQETYGLRTASVVHFLAGEYWAFEKPKDNGEFVVEVSWDKKDTDTLGRLVRSAMLPEAIEIYRQEADVDLRIEEGRVLGDIALASITLTDTSVIKVVQARMPIRPYRTR
jgi:hypothetical protein